MYSFYWSQESNNIIFDWKPWRVNFSKISDICWSKCNKKFVSSVAIMVWNICSKETNLIWNKVRSVGLCLPCNFCLLVSEMNRSFCIRYHFKPYFQNRDAIVEWLMVDCMVKFFSLRFSFMTVQWTSKKNFDVTIIFQKTIASSKKRHMSLWFFLLEFISK